MKKPKIVLHKSMLVALALAMAVLTLSSLMIRATGNI